MALAVQKFYEMVFQMLYCLDYSLSSSEELIELMMVELKITKKAAKEAFAKAQEVFLKCDTIDALIRPISTEYKFERISRVEKNILRLGLYEIFYEKDTPAKVAISEAIRICRKFGSPESAQFVNAILDRIYQESLCTSKKDFNLAVN